MVHRRGKEWKSGGKTRIPPRNGGRREVKNLGRGWPQKSRHHDLKKDCPANLCQKKKGQGDRTPSGEFLTAGGKELVL